MSSISTIKRYFGKALAGVLAPVGHVKAVVSGALAVAAVAAVLAPSQASAETRSLKLYYVHTGEKAEIAFWKDGRFLPDGLKRLNVFLRDWRRNEPTKMDPRLFNLIWQVYRSTGSREYINVVSAYRSPATNAMLRSNTRGVAKKSQHMLGRAMDYYIPGVPLAKLRGIGMRYQIGGVGYYPRSGSPFVHMDVGNVRHWPRMSRRELLALFPDGKTIHVPTDGKPLPGYEAALAMIEKRNASGGGVMMASNSSTPRKSKTLFSALFGGGADEEEDNGDTAAPAARPARATAPARQAPAAVPQAPIQQAPIQQAPVQQNEPMIAALPARDVPRPMEAPRPDAGLGGAPAAVPMPPEAANVPVAAANIPIPGRRPATAPQDAIALAAAAPGDANAALDPNAQVADATQPSPLMNGFVPVPSARPQQAQDNMQLASVAVPTARPDRPQDRQNMAENGGQDAIAALVSDHENGNENGDETVAAAAPQPGEAGALPLPQDAPRADDAADAPLAMAPRKDEIGELIAPPEDDAAYEEKPVAAAAPSPAKVEMKTASVAKAAPAPAQKQVVLASVSAAEKAGVRTTAKGARRVTRTSAKPHAVVQPAALPTSQVAMSTESVSRAVPATNPVLRNDAMRSAPTMVYTTGFQRGDLPGSHANQFSGNAVTFLTVAKFTETN